MSFFSEDEINKIVDLAFEAGEISKKYFRKENLKISIKSDGSKVSEADFEVSNFIKENFDKHFSKIPLICEEGELREFEGDIFWLVDPIDGTTNFIKGEDEFAISIALIKDEKPVFGLIYAPFFEDGKMVFNNHKGDVILIDDLVKKEQKILNFQKNKEKETRIIASKRIKKEDFQFFIDNFYEGDSSRVVLRKISSAIKFIILLEGRADIYLHLQKSMEWDIAAGHALIKNMNGSLKNLLFNENKIIINDEMIYKKANFANHFFIANF